MTREEMRWYRRVTSSRAKSGGRNQRSDLVTQDQLMQMPYASVWIGTQLVAQEPVRSVVGRERLCSPPAAVQRCHEIQQQGFAEGMGRDQILKDDHQIAVTTECQLR